MKYILSVLFLIFFFSGFTQIYQEMPQYGYRANRMAFDSTLQIPTVCGVPTLKSVVSVRTKSAIAFDSCNNKFYTYNPKTQIWSEVSGSAVTPSLQDVATVGNYYTNDMNATIELNKYQYVDGSNYDRYFPFYFTGNPDFIDVAYLGFTDDRAEINISRAGLNGRLVSINSEGILLSENDELTENQSEISINQTGLLIKNNGNTGTTLNYVNSNNNANYDVHMPFQNTTENDTLATLNNIRNSVIDTANKFVNNITRTSGKDSMIFFIGSTRYAIKDSVGSNPAPVGYYGAFADTLNQTIASTTIAYPMNFRVTDLSNGVTVVNNNRILFANAGVYNLQFSAQFTNSSTSTEVGTSIWIRKNGVDVAGSTGYLQLPKKGSGLNGETLPSWNFVLSLAAGDSIVWYWRADNTAASIVSFAAGTSPTRPSTASTILTVTQQSGIMAGTGITGLGTSGNAQTGATQVLATNGSGTDFNISSSGNTHTFNLPTASATNRGALSSANWSTFNSKLGASDTVSLSNRINLKLNITDTANKFVSNISRTVGKDSIIFNIGSTRYAIKDSVGSGGTSYTFSTGLTNSSGTVTSNLSTGVAGGQSVVGGTAASNSLTLSSTTNATKGKLLFGTSAYDEVNNRLGIGTTSPTYRIGLLDANKGIDVYSSSVANDAIKLINNSSGAATIGVQNANATGWSGIEYIDNNGNVKVFTGFNNSNTQEFRFNNIATNGYIDFLIGSTSTLKLFNSRNVGLGQTSDAGYKLDVNGTARATQYNLSALNTAPATATSTGTTGEIRIVNGAIYVCVATNTWQRALLTTF